MRSAGTFGSEKSLNHFHSPAYNHHLYPALCCR